MSCCTTGNSPLGWDVGQDELCGLQLNKSAIFVLKIHAQLFKQLILYSNGPHYVFKAEVANFCGPQKCVLVSKIVFRNILKLITNILKARDFMLNNPGFRFLLQYDSTRSKFLHDNRKLGLSTLLIPMTCLGPESLRLRAEQWLTKLLQCRVTWL